MIIDPSIMVWFKSMSQINRLARYSLIHNHYKIYCFY